MNTAARSATRGQVVQEIDKIPLEYLPSVLQMVRAFRESVTLKSAPSSFRQGMAEALAGDTHPVAKLWDGVDAD